MKRKKTIILLVAIIAAVIYFYPRTPATVDESRRQLATGEVIGFADVSDTYGWMGIPFAEPPLGDLRWRAPQPPLPWRGTLAAVKQPSMCSQILPFKLGGGPIPYGDEDCLYLDVWSPRLSQAQLAESKLPVMVWIHGGANTLGGAQIAVPRNLAGEQKVIVVALQYRLGVFGWFSHPALREAAPTPFDASGNFGLLDMIAALNWVQQNIEAFGGDKNNVTIFGESAGGADVLALLGSPAAKGLFHKAIAQSGNPKTVPLAAAENYRDDPEPGLPYSFRELINRLLVIDGLAADRAAAKTLQNQMSSAELTAYLRGKTAKEIFRGVEPRGDLGYQTPVNLRDGVVLPKTPLLEVLGEPGAYNAVPVILGSNRDEFKLFLWSSERFTRRRWGILPELKAPAEYQRTVAYFSNLWQANGVDEPAARLSRSQPGEVYTYRFEWDEQPRQLGVDAPTLFGAAHGIDVVFLFGRAEVARLPLFAKVDDAASWDNLSRAMRGYWAEFARTGQPGSGGGRWPLWQPWTDDDAHKMILDSQLHSANLALTVADIKARLRGDKAIASTEARCELYAQLFYYGLSNYFWSAQEYQALGCDEFPVSAFRALM
ncbi:carboxylesterase/lipase family protein [Halioxenophilus sp. WMMB6]|uniref:carboxylesterase/lipase family protein n=1 Tax=Halioxenophilus sp. WMMB6 TaxID=3073815 RepID=UPI00295ECDE5|nr:carboxylesterase family protein [Halioxenophilus sp. WMMB6]